MHNPTAHPQTNAQPIPEQWPVAPSQLTPVYIQSMTFHGLEYPLDHFGSAVPDYGPSQLFVHLLTIRAQKTEKSRLMVTTTQQQLKHQHILINIILILNLKHSTVPATKEKINSIPAEIRIHWNFRFPCYCSLLKHTLLRHFLRILSQELHRKFRNVPFNWIWRGAHALHLIPWPAHITAQDIK